MRKPWVEIPLADALMSAFAMFSLKDPSLLAFDHRRHNPNDNFRTIYGINRVPCDSQMRDILDPSLSTWETVKNTGFLRKTVAENYGRRSQIAKNLGKSAILAC